MHRLLRFNWHFKVTADMRLGSFGGIGAGDKAANTNPTYKAHVKYVTLMRIGVEKTKGFCFDVAICIWCSNGGGRLFVDFLIVLAKT